MDSLMEMKGTNGIIFVYEDKAVVSRKSFLGFVTQGGYVGDRTYYYKDIQSIEYRKPTLLANGYIKFIIAGTVEKSAKVGIFASSQESMKDQNTVVLRAFKKETPVQAEKLYSLIMGKISENKNQKNNVNIIGSTSKADELKKLAELKESQVLSEEEFQAEKAKILNS